MDLPYLRQYPETIQQQVRALVQAGTLGSTLKKRYPDAVHDIQSDARLYEFTMALKQQFMRSSAPISKICFDPKIHIVNNALGLHSQVSRVQGKALKSKNEIRVASLLKTLPLPLLKMIVVHELAHLREKDHNKAFYQLCQHMEPQYHQLELDLRLFLTWQDLAGGAPDATN
ncbi:M48 metallopeptidase family protein [Rheinheimera sp.]|uniref:M48 metallopeptidase family protein n=1 Tax=Rheinheimera sp. TaxID=1869214 RepID=UPI003D2BA5AE